MGKMCLMMVQVNVEMEPLAEKDKPQDSHYLLEENHVLKSRLLEGGLDYNTFESKKQEEETQEQSSLSRLSDLEMAKSLKIKDNRLSEENTFLAQLLRREGDSDRLIQALQTQLRKSCVWNNLG